MRIKEAEELLKIPSILIAEIVEENDIECKRFADGDYDFDFKALVAIKEAHRDTFDRRRWYWVKPKPRKKKSQPVVRESPFVERTSKPLIVDKLWYPKKIRRAVKNV